MSVQRPKEYRPELANSDSPQSRDATLRESLGLSKEAAEAGMSDDDETPPPVPHRRASTAQATADRAAAQKQVDSANDARVKELEAENADLKKRLNDQVETMKKLANSRISNVTKSFEEKLLQKDKVVEELQLGRQSDVEQMVVLNSRIKALENQLVALGQQPAAQRAGEGLDIDARIAQELDRLRRENGELRLETAGLRRAAAAGGAESGGADARVQKLEAEAREMKKTIDNLMEVNQKLVSSTKSKIGALELELAHQRAPDAAPRAAPAASGGEAEAVRQLQQVLKDESEAREKAQKEVGALKQQLAAAGAASAAKPAGVPAEEVKRLQVELRDKDKQIGQLTQSLKAAGDDSAIQEKELRQRVQALQAEVERLGREGNAQIQDTKSRIRKCARRIVQDMQRLRGSHGEARARVVELQAQLVPVMKEFYKPLKKAVARLQLEHSGWAEKFRKEAAERKRLHNLVLELKGNIRVFCRIRPKLPHEGDGEGCANAIFFPEDRPELEENTIAVLDESKGTEKIFEFDHTFGLTSTQEEVFAEVEALVTSVLDGYNVCIFAYGQTGSGKTYTMEGTDSDRGINPRTLARLFEQVTEREGYRYSIELSILEIYNEEIRDLLDPKTAKKLEVRQGPDGNFVQDLAREPVSSYEQTNRIWAEARSNRTTFSNNVNEHSSRSHLVISVYARGENRTTGAQSYGKLHLVDLAGSERLSRTNATGDRLKEAQNINKSLSSLGDVIAAAAAKQGHIPYRNSKLTHVLQDSLGQDSKTLMIVQSSPLAKDVGESLCSLQFAIRARSVELGQARKHTGGAVKSAGAAKR